MLAKNHRIIKKLFIIALIVLNSSLFGDLITAQKSKPVMSMSSLVTAEICRMVGEKSLSFKIDSRTVMMEPNRELLKFYKDGKCHPAWSNEKVIDTQAIYLLYSIKESTKNGLDVYNPDYHYENIVELLNFITPDSLVKNNPSVLAQLDILLTDAYMKLGRHLSNGLVPHESIAEVWKYSKHSSHNMSLRLSEALDNKNVKESLEELSSSSYGYQELTKVMMNYLRIQEAGGWKKVEAIGRDEKGDDQYAFDDVKARLRVEGDLVANDDSIEAYEAAVKNFQRRHGIDPDGVIGAKTLSKMNISIEEKITAIRLNMEKWRWMPDEESMYVSVNIPDFSLSVIEGNNTLLKMKAILGREARKTAIFTAQMKYIVVNPYWHVPSTILREDIIPKVKKDIRYLKKERIRIFKAGDYRGKREINPWNINWKKVNANRFPYILRQDPGAKNVLGRIKFMFPNTYDIYIHDTPAKSLFDKEERVFSSGCIRIEKPLDLYAFLLDNDGNDSYANITDLIAQGANKKIFLSKPVKVRIDYWTVWADEKGMAQFRDDVYGYDDELMDILGWH